jgi:hypothetical protein
MSKLMSPPHGAQQNTVGATRPTYELRSIRFIELWQCNGYEVKIYGINPERPKSGELVVAPDFVKAAKSIAASRIANQLPEVTDQPKAAFIVLHEGRLARWVLVDIWRDWILLNHFLYRGKVGSSDGFHRVADGLNACTWELRVVAFERDAWVTEVLSRPKSPDLYRYLNSQLNEDS